MGNARKDVFCEADRVRYGTVQCGCGSAGRPGAAGYYTPAFPPTWGRPLGADLAGLGGSDSTGDISYLNAVADEIGRRPRAILEFKTPAEVSAELRLADNPEDAISSIASTG